MPEMKKFAGPIGDARTELEELPGLISFEESQMELLLTDMEKINIEKTRATSDIILKSRNLPAAIVRAMVKNAEAEHDERAIKLKESYSEHKVEYSRLKNRFASVRKLVSLQIEEMRNLHV